MDYFLFDFSGVQFHYTMSHENIKYNKQNDKGCCTCGVVQQPCYLK